MAKKKTKLKAMARGFATTSVPKKVVQVEEEQDGGIEDGSTSDDIPRKSGTPTGDEVASAEPLKDEFEPEKVEEQSLQNLVDKFQEKIEKEVSRTVKAIHVDRRFSRTLPSLNLDASFVDRILTLARDFEQGEVNKKILDEPEEKLVFRLAITYGVLRRLGFSEARVLECLTSIQGVELDEAFEWLYYRCSDQELSTKGTTVGEHKTSSELRSSQSLIKAGDSSDPRTRSPTPTRSISPPTVSKLDPSAPVFVPLSKSTIAMQGDMEGPSLESRTLAAVESNVVHNGFSGRKSPVLDDPTDQYVRLRLQIDDIKSGRVVQYQNDLPSLQELTRKLREVQKNYHFDEKEAEASYRLERQQVHSIVLRSKLRGSINPPLDRGSTSDSMYALPVQQPDMPVQATPPVSEVVASNISAPPDFDIFDEEGTEQASGMFELLDEMPGEEISKEGIVIRIQDFASPKHWSGKTPKTLLAETVTKADRYAAVIYQIISGPSRGKRAAVKILWEGRKNGEWMMEDVACYTEAQAEQYVALVALHALTYPCTDGFAAGLSGSGSPTFYRSLPAVFRDLWEELEESRKGRDDAINRGIWAKLRNIAETKLDSSAKSTIKGIKAATENRDAPNLRIASHNQDQMSEQLIEDLRVRQGSRAYQEMLQQRNQLPIAKYRKEIVSKLEQSQILVLSGETGCGKSTQVPAFILEDQLSRGKPCKIYCTEPRRISAVSLAERVSLELGDPVGAVGSVVSLVGYSIRLESNTSKTTRLAFVTNGIALRMLEGGTGQGGQGTAFDEITHIIIDEVHERTIESDFLLIVLKSLLKQRSDLRVVLMSATVDAEKIADFFGGCPTLHVPGRTFPVDVRFLEDAIEYTQWSITESSPYAQRSHDKFYRNKNRVDWSEDAPTADDDEEDTQKNVKLAKCYSRQTAISINLLDERLIPYDLILRLLERLCFEDKAYLPFSNAILVFMPGLGEIRRLNDLLNEHALFSNDASFRIYPLHSTLSNENQSFVFDIPPKGVRKIVIATNIAETGITIPDITCVIDSGKHREMRFDEKRQISRLVETFVAKSNAAQRRGRAGRVQNGLCFHLFTKIRHDTQLADHPLPEMMRLSLSDLALRIKIMKINLGTSIEDVLCRAMDPPSPINIQRAISALVEVRALTPSEDITPMGRLLSKLPTDVHLGKFLLVAVVFRCLDPALTIAAALNAKSPFVSPLGLEQEADRAKSSFATENSDFLTIHNAFASWRRASANPGNIRTFCRVNFLSHPNLQQIEELRQQFLSYLIDTSFIQVDRAFVRELNRARYVRNRTRFITVPPELDVNSSNVALVNAALAAGLYPKILAIDTAKREMRTISNNQPAVCHPSSINFRVRPTDFGVNYLSFFTLMQSKKLYAWETGPVDDLAVLLLCGECDFKLISDAAFIDRKIKFHVPPKTNIALKILRTHLTTILAQQFRSKQLTQSQLLWHELAIMVLGKSTINDNQEPHTSIIIN